MLIYQRVATFPENVDGRFWMAPAKPTKRSDENGKKKMGIFVWSISYLFQPLLAENQKKKTHGKIWAKKEETQALQRWASGAPSFFRTPILSQTAQAAR